MKAYWSIVRVRFQMLLQYRAAAIAGFTCQLAWGLMKIFVLGVFYKAVTKPQPMSYPEVVTYIWLGQAMLVMLPWNVDPEIKAMIGRGDVVYELMRPLDLYSLWFARAMALRTAPAILRAIPMFITTGLFFGMQAPPSLESALAWLASQACALLLACALTTLLTMTMLWTIAGEGAANILAAGVTIFSGMVIPLPLYPDWAQPVLNFLPFRGLVDLPYRLYTGNLPPETIFSVLAHQLTWTAILVALGRLILARGVKRMIVQGG